MTRAFVACLLLSACIYEPIPKRAAMSGAVVHFDEGTNLDMSLIDATIVVTYGIAGDYGYAHIKPPDVYVHGGDSFTCSGLVDVYECEFEGGIALVTESDQCPYFLLVHGLGHWILDTEGGDPDANHTNAQMWEDIQGEAKNAIIGFCNQVDGVWQ